MTTDSKGAASATAAAVQRAEIALDTYRSYHDQVAGIGECSRATTIERAMQTYAEQAAEAVSAVAAVNSFSLPDGLDHFEPDVHDGDEEAAHPQRGRGRFVSKKNKTFLDVHKKNIATLEKAVAKAKRAKR